MTDQRHVLTARLELLAPDPARDLDTLYPAFSDPDGWWYEPEGRHATAEMTRRWLTRAAERFDAHGLSYWTARLRETGAVIGTGGVQRQRMRAWNLSYRIAAEHQRRGYAAELCRAALIAAAQVDSAVPVIAWVAAHNGPSRRVAQSIGLVDRGEWADPSDGVTRIAYSDRAVEGFAAPAPGPRSAPRS